MPEFTSSAASGQVEVLTPPGVVEVLPGYQGPRTADDLDYELPPRQWTPIGPDGRPEIALDTATPLPWTQPTTQYDGRSYTVQQIWSGQRFIFKVDALKLITDERLPPARDMGTVMNLFTTHLGKTFCGKPHWTEIGIVRLVQDPAYRLYTYTQNQSTEQGTWQFFGTMEVGDVFEFVIRLNESDTGPYQYETLCSGHRVRQGILPELDNQVDVSHETWCHGGLTPGALRHVRRGLGQLPAGQSTLVRA